MFDRDVLELCALLTLLVKAMVAGSDTVSVTPILSGGPAIVLLLRVKQGVDLGKVIGKQGKAERALRLLVQAIGDEQNRLYQLDIAAL